MHCCCMTSEDPSERKATQPEQGQRKPDRDPHDRDLRLLILFVLAWCLAIAALAVAFMLLV